MKCQVLFSLKNDIKDRMLSASILLSRSRANVALYKHQVPTGMVPWIRE